MLNVKAWEPRGWSILHFVEGYISPTTGCSGAIINSNTFERAGRAPSGAQQFRRRDTGTWGPYMWADGISLACKNSQVTNNAITDATDGGIVIFGSPGSTISGNTITSDARQLLGGINMVSFRRRCPCRALTFRRACTGRLRTVRWDLPECACQREYTSRSKFFDEVRHLRWRHVVGHGQSVRPIGSQKSDADSSAGRTRERGAERFKTISSRLQVSTGCTSRRTTVPDSAPYGPALQARA